MAVPRKSLRGFLAYAKSALKNAIESNQKITLVIGNESADLDSMTSSVLYAYIRSMAPAHNAFTALYVPITNILSTGIHLRPEFLALFKHANIEPGHLITLDDLPDLTAIETKLCPENTRWILVDHNALQGHLGKKYTDCIGGIIDHHEDEGKAPHGSPRLITKAGSCTSLVTECCQQAWESLSTSATISGAAHGQDDNKLADDGAVTKLWDAKVAQFGLASILIDTANLSSQDKTTEHDIKAANYLEAKITSCPQFSGFNRNEFYQEIDKAKKDIGALELQDILRKDYKQWNENGQKLGISSVVKSIDFLQNKANEEADMQSLNSAFINALQRFSKERELDLYAVMTTSTSAEGKFQRELLVWAFNDKAVSAGKEFAAAAQDELGLEDWHGPDGTAYNDSENGNWRKVWWQRNVQHSRKRVAPLLREAMN